MQELQKKWPKCPSVILQKQALYESFWGGVGAYKTDAITLPHSSLDSLKAFKNPEDNDE